MVRQSKEPSPEAAKENPKKSVSKRKRSETINLDDEKINRKKPKVKASTSKITTKQDKDTTEPNEEAEISEIGSEPDEEESMDVEDDDNESVVSTSTMSSAVLSVINRRRKSVNGNKIIAPIVTNETQPRTSVPSTPRATAALSTMSVTKSNKKTIKPSTTADTTASTIKPKRTDRSKTNGRTSIESSSSIAQPSQQHTVPEKPTHTTVKPPGPAPLRAEVTAAVPPEPVSLLTTDTPVAEPPQSVAESEGEEKAGPSFSLIMLLIGLFFLIFGPFIYPLIPITPVRTTRPSEPITTKKSTSADLVPAINVAISNLMSELEEINDFSSDMQQLPDGGISLESAINELMRRVSDLETAMNQEEEEVAGVSEDMEEWKKQRNDRESLLEEAQGLLNDLKSTKMMEHLQLTQSQKEELKETQKEISSDGDDSVEDLTESQNRLKNMAEEVTGQPVEAESEATSESQDQEIDISDTVDSIRNTVENLEDGEMNLEDLDSKVEEKSAQDTTSTEEKLKKEGEEEEEPGEWVHSSVSAAVKEKVEKIQRLVEANNTESEEPDGFDLEAKDESISLSELSQDQPEWDYAVGPMGGEVVRPRKRCPADGSVLTSFPYLPQGMVAEEDSGEGSGFVGKIWNKMNGYIQKKQSTVTEEELINFVAPELGRCFSFEGDSGVVTVALSNSVVVRAVELVHMLPDPDLEDDPESPVADISKIYNLNSTPFQVVLIGWGMDPRKVRDVEKYKYHLGEYVFDVNDVIISSLEKEGEIEIKEVFEIPERDVVDDRIIPPLKAVSLFVIANNGNMEFTCLYRVRVLGKKAEVSEE